MIIKKKFKLAMVLLVSSLMYACEKERSLTLKEMAESWKLYVQIKYFRSDDDQEELAKKVAKLLKQGALPTINFERDITALRLAQLKKLDRVVAIMNSEESLNRVWKELEKRGFIKKSNL